MKHTMGDTPDEEPNDAAPDHYWQQSDSEIIKTHNQWSFVPPKSAQYGPEKTPPMVVPLYGLTPLKEMDRADMIAEILNHQRKQLEALDTSVLLENVVHVRVSDYANRLHKDAHEAGA